MTMQRHATLQDGNSVKTTIAAAALIAALATAASGIPARADQIKATWNGGAGSWTDPNWTFIPSPMPEPVFPDNNSNSFDVSVPLDPSEQISIGTAAIPANIAVDNVEYSNSGSFPSDEVSLVVLNGSSLLVSNTFSGPIQSTTAVAGTLLTRDLVLWAFGDFRVEAGGVAVVTGATEMDRDSLLSVAGSMTTGDIQVFSNHNVVIEDGSLSTGKATFDRLDVFGGEVTSASIKGLISLRVVTGSSVTVTDDLEFRAPPQPQLIPPFPGGDPSGVDGPDSRLTIGRNLVIPGFGGLSDSLGKFNITNGARITVGTDADITDTAVVIDAASSMTVGNVFKLTESTLMVGGRLTTGTLVVDPSTALVVDPSTVTLEGGVIKGDVTVYDDDPTDDRRPRLEGTGTIIGTVTVQGGELAPGLSIGTLTVEEDLLFESGLLEIQVDVTGRNTFVVDLIEILGTATLSNVDLVIMFTGAGILDQGTMIEFLTAGELDQFDLRSLQVLGLERGIVRPETMLGEDGGLSLIALTEVKVPEPATMLIFAFGLAGIGAAARRRRAA